MLHIVFCKHPGHRFVNVLVCPSEHREYLTECICGAVCVYVFKHLVASGSRHHFQIVVDRFFHALVAHDSAEILVGHSDGALHEIAVYVDKFRIDDVNHHIPTDKSVVVERHLREKIISHRIHAEEIDEIVRIDDVALRF